MFCMLFDLNKIVDKREKDILCVFENMCEKWTLKKIYEDWLSVSRINWMMGIVWSGVMIGQR